MIEKTEPRDLAEKAIKILKYLSICHYGLSDYELTKILGIQNNEDLNELICRHLGDLVSKYQLQWRIDDKEFRRYVKHSVVSSEERVTMHMHISSSYQVTMDKNILLLEERIYHLYKAKDFSGLKQFLADIEHFLFLYNPFTKRNLFLYWRQLEKAGFEPVIEYSKAIDSFEVRANPTSYNLLQIILQLSRFFKEFADFEEGDMPDFKHPHVLNKHFLRGEAEFDKSKACQKKATGRSDCFSKEG